MPHPWIDLVVGGVSNPRFLCCSSELCSNTSFESNMNGWEHTAVGADIVRTVDPTTQFGNYSALISAYSGASYYAYYNYAYGSSLAEKHIMVCFFAKGSTTSTKIKVELKTVQTVVSLTAVGARTNPTVFTLNADTWTFIFVEGIVPVGNTSTDVRLYLWPCDPTTDPYGSPPVVYTVSIDKVTMRITELDYTLDVPHAMKHGFKKIKKTEVIRLDGEKRESILGHRHTCSLEYELLDATDEAIRRQLKNFNNLFFFPHNDVNWGYFALIGDIDSDYFHDKYVGHSGEIELESCLVFREGLGDLEEAIAQGVGGFGGDIFIG